MPQRAAAISNALMQTFVAQVSSENQARIAAAGASLNSQIRSLQARLLTEEHNLAMARAQHADVSSFQNQILGDSTLLTQLTSNYSSFRAQQVQSLDAVSVGARASVPSEPSSPRPRLDLVLGALVGLAVGLGGATLIQYFDQRMRSPDDVSERLGLSTLAVVPLFSDKQSSGSRSSSVSATMEAWETLRTNVLFSAADYDADVRSIVVTSYGVGEGKVRHCYESRGGSCTCRETCPPCGC